MPIKVHNSMKLNELTSRRSTNHTPTYPLILSTVVVFSLIVASTHPLTGAEPNASSHTEWSASVVADFGTDQGQNHGSLFEIKDSAGNLVAGAGFLGAFNTECRSGRQTLHVFAKSNKQKPKVDFIARPSTSSGTYLDDFRGQLFARARAEKPSKGVDGIFRVWDSENDSWSAVTNIRPLPTEVGGKILQTGAERTDQRANGTFHTHGDELDFGSKTISWGSHTLLRLGASEGYFRELYYANGYLIFRINNPTATPIVNSLYACRWTPGKNDPVLSEAIAIPLSWKGEFLYAFGQLNDETVIASNSGAILSFHNGVWKTIRAANRKVSFQVYSMLTYNDQLLMGHYPTGQIYRYDGATLKHLENWPPVPPNVSLAAREAQTLTIYGGDLYVGVWPWGEIWKLDSNTEKWDMVYRAFRSPAMAPDFPHPYQRECMDAGIVSNAWGQRITSFVPLNDAMFIATSSKRIANNAHKMPFLSNDKWKEYGQIHQYRVPGTVTAQIKWKDELTRIEVKMDSQTLSVVQDGEILSKVKRPQFVQGDSNLSITWGSGLYGTFRGTLLEKRFTDGQQR